MCRLGVHLDICGVYTKIDCTFKLDINTIGNWRNEKFQLEMTVVCVGVRGGGGGGSC